MRPKYKDTLLKQLQSNDNLKTATHITLVGVPIGVMVGVAIAAYDYVVNALIWEHFTTKLSPEVLCILPFFGMILTGLILKAFKVSSPSMADEIVKTYHHPEATLEYGKVLPKLAASTTTMGLGCSAGMEGASKWLGGSISSFVQAKLNQMKWAKLLHGKAEITMLAGAAAGISAIFRAPLTGAIMGIESPYKKDLAHDALIHGLVASAISYATFVLLRNSDPYFPIRFHYTLQIRDLIFCVPLGILAGLSSHLFLGCLHSFKALSTQLNRFRLGSYVVGGILAPFAWVS